METVKAFFRRYWFYCILFLWALAAALDLLRLDWPILVLLLLSGFAVWMPTLARYIKALEKTPDGWKVLLQDDPIGLPADEIQIRSDKQAVKLTSAHEEKKDFASYSMHAQRVLKTLWHFQLEIFPHDDGRRWGFGVAPQSPDFPSFSIGAKELEWDKLVFVDPKGLAYLTNEGVTFCKKEQAKIDAAPLYYSQFVAA